MKCLELKQKLYHFQIPQRMNFSKITVSQVNEKVAKIPNVRLRAHCAMLKYTIKRCVLPW